MTYLSAADCFNFTLVKVFITFRARDDCVDTGSFIMVNVVSYKHGAIGDKWRSCDKEVIGHVPILVRHTYYLHVAVHRCNDIGRLLDQRCKLFSCNICTLHLYH